MTKKSLILGGITATAGFIAFFKHALTKSHEEQMRIQQLKENALVDFISKSLTDNKDPRFENKTYKSKVYLGGIVYEDGQVLTEKRYPISQEDTTLLFDLFEKHKIQGFIEMSERNIRFSSPVLTVQTTFDSYLFHPDDPSTLQDKIRVSFAPKPT